MSETLGQEQSTEDAVGGDNAPHLYPFSAFAGDMSEGEQRLLAADARLLDISTWEYYDPTRMDRDHVAIVTSQPQYRPWESMPLTASAKEALLRSGFTFSDAGAFQPITAPSKLPSFQSQFQSFPETAIIPETGLPNVTAVPVPSSPGNRNATSPTLTPLTGQPSAHTHLTTLTQVTPLSSTLTTLSPVNTTFHTLTAVNARSYPIVPAPIQPREPAYLDDRHIQLYQPNITTINTFQTQNGTHLLQNGSLIQNIQNMQNPTVLHVLKNEPGPFEMKIGNASIPVPVSNGLHHANFQNPLTAMLDNDFDKAKGFPNGTSPTRSDFRKKERRKIRASSLESNAESDGSSMEIGSENSGQVAAVSSTAGFKSPLHGIHTPGAGSVAGHDGDDISSEKQTKKKRKRCGECIGCQRKDNCGDCAPCRNDKSHQICKQRRCEKLTEKKLVFGPDGTLQTVKGESRRGRGRGRGSGGSYRGRKSALAANALASGLSPGGAPQSPAAPQAVPQAVAPAPTALTVLAAPAPNNTTAMKQDHPSAQPMAPMPFYASDPNRFPAWQTDPTQGWQNQFIQQLPPQGGQTGLDYQANHAASYATAPHLYQTNASYAVQNIVPNAFDSATNAFYQTQPVQVNAQRPPSAAPRNNSYAHAPSPSPGAHRNGANQQYAGADYGHGNQSFPQPSTTPNSSMESRPNSVGNNGGFQTISTSGSSAYTSMAGGHVYSQASFPATSVCNAVDYNAQANAPPENAQYPNGNGDSQQQHSGNAEPGYPQRSDGPQASLDCSGYPGGFGGGQPEWPDWSQHHNGADAVFSQADRVNLNSRLKTMILNKQTGHLQEDNAPPDKNNQGETLNKADAQNSTGHFLSYSHHLRDDYRVDPAANRSVGNYTQNAQNYSQIPGDFGGGGQPAWEGDKNKTKGNYENFMKYAEMYDAENSMYNQTDNKDFQSKMTIGPVSEMNQQNHYSSTTKDVNAKYKPIPISLTPKLEVNDYQYPNANRPYRQPPAKPATLPPISTIKHESFANKGFQMSYSEQSFLPEPKPGFQKYAKTSEPEMHKPTDNQKQTFFIEQIKSEHSPPGHKIYKNINYASPKIEKQPYLFAGDGGPGILKDEVGYSCCRRGSTKRPPPEHLRDGACAGLQTKDEILEEDNETEKKPAAQTKKEDTDTAVDKVEIKEEVAPTLSKEYLDNIERLKSNTRTEVPDCSCFTADKNPPEPGSYYTHLGTAATIIDLRKDLETRTGLSGKELRIEKICYTGKEGKTTQGCPMAKWVIRRSSYTEKVLVVVKFRSGHKCSTAWIVVCLVAWEGVPSSEADLDYTLLSHKLNRFGLPTTRRCATNENRTCACQGLDPESCGASFSFGCSWSMYYNGCKYARSKTVRKFRLSVKTEEQEVEERMNVLATLLSPLYSNLAPKAFENQCQFEREASDCRLGFKPGRPFSGVTACLDFCAHSHRDLHNMNNGCTAVVTLARHRTLAAPSDEQLHVLPLYTLDSTDEFGSKDGQDEKIKTGAVQALEKYPCEVRVRSVPLQPCRRHGKKRKDEESAEGANNSLNGSGSGASQSGSGPSTPNGAAGSKKGQASPRASAPHQEPPRGTCASASPRSHHSMSPVRSQTPTGTSAPAYGRPPPAHFGSAFANPNASAPPGLLNPNLTNPSLLDMASMIDNFTDAQLQSNQISSTVLDSPYNPYDQSYGHGHNLHHQNGAIYGAHPHPILENNASCQNSPQIQQNFAIETAKRPPHPNAEILPPVNPQHSSNDWPPDLSGGDIFNFKDGPVKEDPDSTTANLNLPPPNYSPDSNGNKITSPLPIVDNINRDEPKNKAKLPGEFEIPYSSKTTLPQSPIQMKISDAKSPSTMDMSPNLINHDLNEKNANWRAPEKWDQSAMNPTQWDAGRQNWDQKMKDDNACIDNTIFRVPKARPPSRCQNTIPNSPDAHDSTFLKPFPPVDKPHLSQGYDNRSPYDARMAGNANANRVNQNFTINHDDSAQNPTTAPCPTKPAMTDYPTGNYQSAYNPQTHMQGFGNYPQMTQAYPFTPNPYGHFNPYENTYNDYNLAYYNAEKLKREEFLRNSHCYNSYGYQNYPNFTPNFYHQNPSPNWCQSPPNWCLYPPPFSIPYPPETPKSEPIGEVTDYVDNLECFKDGQMGGVAIALGHGSVLFECAKHEMHSTTALKSPDRLNPARISLVFYQHRNLNRPKHGLDEWEEKMRLKKLGIAPAAAAAVAPPTPAPSGEAQPEAGGCKEASERIPGGYSSLAALVDATANNKNGRQVMLRAATLTTMSWTTLFPMHGCTVTGPYQESPT